MNLSKASFDIKPLLINFNTHRIISIAFLILACLLILSINAASVNASISKSLDTTSSFVAPFNIPPGISITLTISYTYSGTVSIKSPSGIITDLSFSKISGPYSANVNFSETGNYEVTEKYTVYVVSKSLLGEQPPAITESDPNIWTFNNLSAGIGKFNASSSVTGVSVSNITGPVSVSLGGSSLPTTAVITITDLILVGTSISATVSSNWAVNSSIEPPPSTGTIEVHTNHDSATFNLSGPASYSGSGKDWTKLAAPIGEYTITYGNIIGYTTPPSEKKILTLAGNITFNGQYVPKVGDLDVVTNIDEATFTISGPEGKVYNGSGKSWTLPNALIGRYIINFNGVPGYTTPSPSVQTLAEGGKITFNGEYIKLIPGTIEVNTNLEQASFMLSGPSLYTGSGLSWTKTEAPLGEYAITYNQIAGYETPSPERKILTSGGTITFYAEYKKIYPGTIEVYTNIDEAVFAVRGPSSYDGSGKAWTQSDVPIGTYTITYANVSGFRTPPSETKILASGGTITFNAKYKQIIPNAIEVYTNLDEATFDIKGPVNYSGSGQEWVQTDVPKGEYTIIYGDVQGYKIPLPETKTLLAGGEIIFTVEYIPLIGTIVVKTNLDQATFELSGRDNYSGSGTEWTKTNALVGEYTITYSNVNNYITPPPATQKLNSNSILTFVGEYKQYDPGTIEVKSNIDSASFTILGPKNYEGKGTYWKQDNAPPGEYTIFFDNVPDHDTPNSEKKSLVSNGIITFTGDYKVHVGTITVNTNLDESTFKLSGPYNTSYIGNGKTWTQTGAPVGEYTITYDDVTFYEVPISETKTLLRDSEIQFIGTYNPISPTIQKVTVSGSPASLKSTIRITVITDPKCHVTFSIEDIKSGELLELSTPGTYTTSFASPKGFDAINAPVSVKVKNGINLETTDSTQTITIDTLARITSISLSNENPPIGENVTITVIGDPKSNVSFSIAGVTQGQMAEDKNNPGTYIATFTVLKKINNASVDIRLIDPSGNMTTNSDKKISTTDNLGTITVRTNLEKAKFKVKGTLEYNGTGQRWSKQNVGAGQYTIVYEDIIGYETPSSETKIFSESGKLAFIGGYKPKYGTIEVVTNLDEAKFKVSGPAEYDGSGKLWIQKLAPDGDYTITFLDVSGYVAPQLASEALCVGCNVIFYGMYTPAKGTIIVRTNLESAEFKLIGPAEYEGNGKYWKMTDVPFGKYTIEYKKIPGYEAPLPETKNLVGESIAFIGGYEETELPTGPNRVQFSNKLMPNFPNPCNPGTWIPFSLSESGEVNIAVYDIGGRMVRRLELGYKTPGLYVNSEKSAYWDGNNESGEKVASGVYFYHIRSGKFLSSSQDAGLQIIPFLDSKLSHK